MHMLMAVAALMAGAPLLEGFDVPLMPGLAEVADARVTFDKEEGSIIETVLEGQAPASKAQVWYASSLPGLGWKLEAATSTRQVYQRGADRLVIDYSRTGATTRVRLLLEPALESAPEPSGPQP